MASENSVLGINIEARSQMAATVDNDTQAIQRFIDTSMRIPGALTPLQQGFANLMGVEGDTVNTTNTFIEQMMRASSPEVWDSFIKGLNLAHEAQLRLTESETSAGQASQTHLADILREEEAYGQMTKNLNATAEAWENLKVAQAGGGITGGTAGAAAQQVQGVEQLDVAWQKVLVSIMKMGESGPTAINMVTAAAQQGITPAEMLAMVNNENWVAMQRLASEGYTLAEVNKILAGATQEEVLAAREQEVAHGSAFQAMRAGRLMIAGLLADMALMNIAMGEQVPASTREAVKEIQIVINTATAAAFAFQFLGMSIGTGLAVGAAIGILEIIASGALDADQNIGELNKSLDQLGKSATNIQTLSNLLGINEQLAETVMADAKANDGLAVSLKNAADAREHLNDVQKSAMIPEEMGGATGEQVKQAQAQDQLAQATLRGAIAADQERQAFKQLTDELSKDTFKNSADQLSQLANVSQEVAKNALDFARNNATAASAIQVYTTNVVSASASLAAYRAEGGSDAQVIQALTNYIEQNRQALQGQVEAASRLAEVDAQFKGLESTLSNIAGTGRSAASELSNLTGESEKYAAAVLKGMSGNTESARAIEDLVAQIKQEKEALIQNNEGGTQRAVIMQRLIELENQLRVAVQAAADEEFRQAQIEAGASISAKRAEEAAAATKAVQTESQQELTAQQNATDQIDRAWQSLTNDLNRLAQQRADAVMKEAQDEERAQRTLADSIERANRTMDEALQKAQQSLGDRLSDINQQYYDKVFDQAFQYQQKLENLYQEQAKNRQTLADKLVQIATKEAEDLANAAFTAGQDLEKAKTQNQADEIRERYLHEAGVIEQRAGDERSTAERTFREEMAQLAERRKQIDEEYQHELMVDARTRDEEVAKAQRSYAEQVAAARQRNADEIADAEKRNQQELADMRQRLANEEASLDQQAANDRARTAQQVADIQAKLAQQTDLIHQRYADEIKAQDLALENFIRVENEKLLALAREYDIAAQIYALEAALYGGAGGRENLIAAGYTVRGKEEGGPVQAGQPYMVGERGAELFVPNQSGTILSHGASPGGNSVNFAPNISFTITATDGADVINQIKLHQNELGDLIVNQLERSLARTTVWQ